MWQCSCYSFLYAFMHRRRNNKDSSVGKRGCLRNLCDHQYLLILHSLTPTGLRNCPPLSLKCFEGTKSQKQQLCRPLPVKKTNQKNAYLPQQHRFFLFCFFGRHPDKTHCCFFPPPLAGLHFTGVSELPCVTGLSLQSWQFEECDRALK